MKKIFAICAVFLLALGLTGCDNDYGNDGREIRDRLIVQGIGVDRTADGYLLTLQAFNTAVAGGQDDGMSGNVTKVYETSGATIADAMRNVTLTAGRRPLYSHNWIIVFGADVAREGLNETLDFLCGITPHGQWSILPWRGERRRISSNRPSMAARFLRGKSRWV